MRKGLGPGDQVAQSTAKAAASRVGRDQLGHGAADDLVPGITQQAQGGRVDVVDGQVFPEREQAFGHVACQRAADRRAVVKQPGDAPTFALVAAHDPEHPAEHGQQEADPRQDDVAGRGRRGNRAGSRPRVLFARACLLHEVRDFGVHFQEAHRTQQVHGAIAVAAPAYGRHVVLEQRALRHELLQLRLFGQRCTTRQLL